MFRGGGTESRNSAPLSRERESHRLQCSHDPLNSWEEGGQDQLIHTAENILNVNSLKHYNLPITVQHVTKHRSSKCRLVVTQVSCFCHMLTRLKTELLGQTLDKALKILLLVFLWTVSTEILKVELRTWIMNELQIYWTDDICWTVEILELEAVPNVTKSQTINYKN